MLKKYEKIVVSGCSFTQGYGLEEPSEYSWPGQLGKKINLPVINLAKSGRGNEYIINSIVDYFSTNPQDTENSLVIIGFTAYPRQDFYDTYTKVFFSTISDIIYKSPFVREFWERHYDDQYYYTLFLRRVLLIQEFLKSKKIDYVIFNAVDTNNYETRSLLDIDNKILQNINMEKFLWDGKKSMIDFYGHNPKGVQEDGHPSELGHKIFAEILYKELLN